MVLSLVAKAYREDFCNNFKDDPVNNKLELIRQRYQLNELAKN